MNRDYFIKVLDTWKSRIKSIDGDEKDELYLRAKSKNGWFTGNFIDLAFKGLYNYLDSEKLIRWIESFDVLKNYNHSRKVGIVMAGNIPLVGIHDLLCVMATGHKAMIKLSSQDSVLLPFLLDLLYEIDPTFKSNITVIEKLEKPDAVIATGSNNSARYFNYYFKNIPHIIRKNRSSIGVLNGNEEKTTLNAMGVDILSYYGLGCRNISKIYIPAGFDFNNFFESIESLDYIFNTQKYVNNYDYNKSIYLVNMEKFLDNGFLMLKQSNQLVSPVSVVFYENYENVEELHDFLIINRDRIQCIASDKCWYEGSIEFGKTQFPDLWDYADNINTIDFLNNI